MTLRLIYSSNRGTSVEKAIIYNEYKSNWIQIGRWFTYEALVELASPEKIFYIS